MYFILHTHQACTVRAKRRLEVSRFMKLVLKSTLEVFQCVAIRMDEIFLHLLAAYHSVAER